MSVFILNNLSKTFVNGKTQNKVLKNINLSFPEKGLFSIVGKSGCGKSTLLNILMGIEKPTEGKVLFNGKDISKMNDKLFSKYHLTGVSLIFQHYNLFNDLTALENVILPLKIAGKNKHTTIDKGKELFSKFHIENLMNRKVKKLSGGEKQRVAILRSIISEPSAILCDEPTGALDSKNSREIMDILREISKNKLVIMVSHNQELVNDYSDKIIHLIDGKIDEKSQTNFTSKSIVKTEEKIHYNSRWTLKFLGINLKKNLKKNLFSIFACLLSFSAMFISVGFSEGSKISQNDALQQNLGIGFATASESEFIDIEGSPLLYEKTVKPDVSLIDHYFSDLTSLRYEENISYFISNYPTCYFNNNKLTNFEMIPLFDSTLQTYGKNMITRGRQPNGDFEEIIINEEFNSLLGGNAINKVITISNESTVNFQTGDIKKPFIKDNFSFTKKFKIVSIVHEFSFLNSPKIYYSYNGGKEYLKNALMENTTKHLNHKYSFYDYLLNCKNDDPACSYSSFVFVTDINEINPFFEKIKNIKDEKLQISSKAFETKETYTTFINSFSSTLIIFVIIAFAGINFILGMISLSTFLENRKNTAILTCLGGRNSSIYDLHLKENYLVIIFSFILSILFSKFLESKINQIIYTKFMLKNLITIPYKMYNGVSYGLIILLGCIAIICSTLFTLIPMIIYRHNSITNELRDE